MTPTITVPPVTACSAVPTCIRVYTRADAEYTGRVTVPVLWDKAQNTIVSNESAEIIRMFNYGL